MLGNLRLRKAFSLLVILALVFMAVPVSQAQAASSLCVDPSNTPTCYATIQEAINAAVAGDTINVASGKYVENVNVNKAITLVGAGAASTSIVATNANATPLIFSTHNATVDGFTITHEYTPAELSTWSTPGAINNNDVTFNQSTTGNTLQNCTVTLGRNGVYLNNTQGNIIKNNVISNNRTGINTTNNVNNTQITGNTISGNWTIGLVYYWQTPAAVTNFSTWTVSGNTFDANWYSEILVKNAGASTGALDVSGNTFTDSPVTYTDSADASLNEPSFESQQPVSLGGTATKPATDLPTLRIYNSPSASIYYPGKTLQVGSGFPYATIQAAIDAASAGDIVSVAAGTYTEQVSVSGRSNLVIVGAGEDQTTIISPDVLTALYGDRHAVVGFDNSTNITIRNLTIDGAGKAAANYRMYGLFFHNTGGLIDHVTVKDVRYNPFNGMQSGVGIYVYNDDGISRTITATNNTVFHYQKGGLVFNGVGLTADVESNTATGYGHTNQIAMNGIQIGFGATGTIKNNTTSGNFYTGDPNNGTAAGILLYQASNVVIEGNVISDSNSGIAVSTSSSNVTIRSNTLSSNDYGISLDTNSTAGIAITNKIVGSLTMAVSTDETSNIEAVKNWWGSPAGPLSSQLEGSVTYLPWCLNEACTLFGPVDGKLILPSGVSAEEIQQAIDNAPANTIIVIPAGTYNFSGGYHVDNPHLTILLEDGVVIQNSSPCFDVNASYTTITTESTGGATCVPTDNANGINVADGLQNVIIQGLEIDGSGQTSKDGIRFLGAITDVQVLDNYIHDLGGNGLTFAAAPAGVVDVQGNLFKANGGVGVSAPANLDVSYNSWGDYAGPSGTNGDGIDGVITSFTPWTFANSYMMSSGTPWDNQVLPGYDITYTVYADLHAVEGTTVSVVIPAGMTFVETNCVSGQCSGTFDNEAVTQVGDTLTFTGTNLTSAAVSGQAMPLFTFTMTGVSGENPLVYDAATTAFAMAPAGGPSNHIYTDQLSEGIVNVIADLPTMNAVGLDVPFTVGYAQEFSLVINNPVAGVAYAHPQLQFTLPADAVLQYYNGSNWVSVSGGTLNLAALAASGSDVTVQLRVKFNTQASVNFKAELYETTDVSPDALLASVTKSFDVYDSTSLTGTFSMQGRTVRSGIPVTLTGTLFGALNGTTIDVISGNLTINNVVGYDTYTVTTNQPRYLNVTADLNKTVDGDAGTMAALELKGGNAVWTDNEINLNDASEIGTDWGSNLDVDGDVNFSGKVDIFDLAIVGGNYNLTSGTAYGTWVP